MRTPCSRTTVLLIVLSLLAACGSREDVAKLFPSAQADAPQARQFPDEAEKLFPPARVAAAPVRQLPEEIVFRGRYYRSEECRRTPDGGYACGMFNAVEVGEVVRGKLKLVRLIHPDLPEGLKEGVTYTFRWKPEESVYQELRKAEVQGYTGMWVFGERLKLDDPTTSASD
jgi:hypothetical protein